MQVHFGKKRRIQFTDRTHPIQGIASAVVAVLSFVFMNALFISSGIAQGMGGLAYGYLGIANLILSAVGFVVALRCLKKDDIYVLTPTIGAVVNGIIIIIYLILYLVGAFR